MSDPGVQPKKRIKMVAYIVTGAMIVIGIILSVTKKEEKPVPADEKPAAVSIITVKPADTSDIMIVPGVLEPWHESVISSQQSGRIVAIAVEKGGRVGKGDVLMSIDSKIQELALKRAEITKADAESDFLRWDKLKKTGSVSDDEMESVRKNRELAGVAYAEAEEQLAYCTLKAPVEGVVADRMVEVGEYVVPGMSVFELVEDRRLKLVVSIPERDIYSVKEGQELSFSVPAAGDKIFSGKVIFVSPRAEKSSNSFTVELAVENSEGELKPGCIASLSFERSVIKGRIIVPLTALIPVRGQYVAFVVKENRAFKRVVRIESILGSEAVVESGLEDGDVLVTMGHRTLEDGMTVKVVE